MPKSSKSINTAFSNFDYRILLILLFLIVLGLSIFFIKYNKYIDCDNAEFFVIAERFEAQEVIEFKNETKNVKTWEWNFGDGTPLDYRKDALHKYENPGVYHVKLTLNGKCVKEKIIEIKNYGNLVNSSKVPQIMIPKVVEAGKLISFEFKYQGTIFSTEWSFGESEQLDNTQPNPTYTYSIPGMKTVTLIVNGDIEHIAKKTIYVAPRTLVESKIDTTKFYNQKNEPEYFERPLGNPQEDPLVEYINGIKAKPTSKPIAKVENLPTIAPDISEEQFELLLLQVANQSKTKEDFAQYLCGNFEIPVIKDNDKILKFSEFCKNIKGKEIRIDALRLTRNNVNCVDGFSISYKVKEFFIWQKD